MCFSFCRKKVADSKKKLNRGFTDLPRKLKKKTDFRFTEIFFKQKKNTEISVIYRALLYPRPPEKNKTENFMRFNTGRNVTSLTW